jgi:23S rRNA pseudouridine2605 synthase
MRVTKLIAERGIASRREAERLIAEGAVTVNGQVLEEPGRVVDPQVDHVKVRGKRLPGKPRRIVLAMNKPVGCLTTTDDPEDRPTVVDLLDGSRYHGKVDPVGRLDFGTEGLLLFTNDGDLAHQLTHPSFKVPKTYKVKITGELTPKKLQLLRRGVPIEGGRTGPAVVIVTEARQRNSWLRITLCEGRNRIIRRMIEFVGHRVLRLRRTSIGGLELGGIVRGRYRLLDGAEVKGLQQMAEGEGATTFQKLLDRQAKGISRPPRGKPRKPGTPNSRKGPTSSRKGRPASRGAGRGKPRGRR